MHDALIYTGATVAAACAVSLAGVYAGLAPGSQLFGHTLVAPRRPGEITLTFDDGPNPEWTPRLLDSLAAHGVTATFFVIGQYAAQEHALIRRMAAEGHIVGNHSWSHPNLAWCSEGRVRTELQRSSDELEQILGRPVELFRPPFGARRPVVLQVARELGMTPVLWNAMTSDWSAESADWVANRLIAKIERAWQRGYAATVVLHDGGHLETGAYRAASVGAAETLMTRYAKKAKFVEVAR